MNGKVIYVQPEHIECESFFYTPEYCMLLKNAINSIYTCDERRSALVHILQDVQVYSCTGARFPPQCSCEV